MGYQEAKDIRKTKFADLLAEKIVGGDPIASSFAKTISEKTKAKVTGIKEKIDPMNIAKFMTGGSNLAPALMGRLLGRNNASMRYFTGKSTKSTDTASKIGSLERDNQIVEKLFDIYEFLKSSHQNDIKAKEQEENKKEGYELEKKRRHEELLRVLSGKKVEGIVATEPTADKETGVGFLGNAVDAAVSQAGKSILQKVGSLLVGGGFMTAAAVSAAFGLPVMYLMSRQTEEQAQETTKGILSASGGTSDAAAITEVVANTSPIERKKQNLLADRPSNKKSLLFWKDGDLQNKYLEEIGWDEKTGTTKVERDKGVVAIDSSGKPVVKKQEVNKTTETPAKTTKPPAPAPVKETVQPLPASNNGQVLNEKTSENLNLNLPTPVPEVVTNTINNTNVTAATKPQQAMGAIPSVRNTEKTFADMILYSTRIV